MQKEKEFWVIGVGASAGGLEALSSFFRSLPENPNAAFIVAQHLAPHAKSMMVELLSRQTKLPVVAVTDNVSLKPGIITVIPPNYDATVVDGGLKLTLAGNETRPKPSVDTLFQSLGQAYRARAVGIILSGTGSDGTEGIRSIKENGGVTFVQDNESAKYDGMPSSAADAGFVDVVLPPQSMAEQLFSILDNREKILPPQELNEDEKVDFQKILSFLKKEIGTDFSQYKISTIQRRIEKRLLALRMKNLNEYFDYLKTNSSELMLLSQNMLVSVTSFFRDPDSFKELEKHLEEIVSKKNNGEEFRVWSAGCATGEEAYTLAFILHDLVEKSNKLISIKIFATDLDVEALSTARQGVYNVEDIKGLSSEIVGRFFDEKEGHFEIKKFIKESIVFAKQDLVQNPPFVKLDLISCRNVLIYFENVLQNRVFDIFHYALKPGGILFLGKSESPNMDYFKEINRKEKIFTRINTPAKIFHGTKYKVSGHINTGFTSIKKIPHTDINSAVAPLLIQMFGLCGVVVDQESAIVQIFGNVSDYVSIPTGQPDFRLSNLLQKNASIEFMILLKKAQKDNSTVSSRVYRLDSGHEEGFRILVRPIELADDDRKLFIVAFEGKKVPNIDPDYLVREGDMPARILELEQEVTATKENLQTLIEELEISNEELQSLNEEMSSTNEELQASNEELETTNEELQSTNEELMTLNEEISIKSSELRIAYSSLDNIQSSIPSPLVVVDKEFRIIRYNPSTRMVFNLSPHDVGVSILAASCYCEIPDFEKHLKETIETGKIAELISYSQDKIFQLRIHPNCDEKKNIIGAILIFFDNTDFINSQEKLKTSDRRIRAIVDSSPTLISLKDNYGRYLLANEAFLKHYKLSESEVVGFTDREIFAEDFATAMRENDLEVFLKRNGTEIQETLTHKGVRSTFLTNRFPLYGNNERNPYAIGVVALDITQQVLAQKFLEASETRYRAIVEDQAVFVCRHTPDWTISFANKSFISYFGAADSRSFLNLVSQKDQSRVSKEISGITPEHPIVQYEYKLSGMGHLNNRWVRWIHRGIFDDHGILLEYQAVGFDVTEVHNQTAHLLAKENLYTHVLEHTSDYLSVFLMKGREFYLESFNQSAANNRGFNNPRLIGKNLRDLVDSDQVETTFALYLKAIDTNAISTFEETIQGPGGVLFLSTTIVPIFDQVSNETRVVSMSRDITKLKRVEKALREEKKNADSANKAKTDFLASMSHELRTPLNVIMGMSQLLMKKEVNPGSQRLVESIQRSSKVLLALIEDVLDLSKIEAGKIALDYKPFDLKLLVNDVIQAFETQASQRGLKLINNFNLDSDTPLIGDEVRLKQIFINLVGNAIKFTENGSVTFNTSLRTKGLGHKTIYFEVVDTGIGIPPEAFPKIFKRFSQADSGTSRKFGGTGLGLAISKQLSELMNGEMGFASEEGSGSTFWLKMNFAVAEAEDAEAESIPKDYDFSNINVLAVDDNPEALKVLKFFFEEHGIKAQYATSGREALEKIENSKFSVVLMDMQMPGMDGLETTRIVRAREDQKQNTSIIALTANALTADKESCLAAGMNDYLSKPIEFELLKRKLVKWSKNV